MDISLFVGNLAQNIDDCMSVKVCLEVLDEGRAAFELRNGSEIQLYMLGKAADA